MKNIFKFSKKDENGVQTVSEKKSWSLKKKLAVGGGILSGLVLGGIALLAKNNKDTEDDGDFDEDEEDDDLEADEDILDATE